MCNNNGEFLFLLSTCLIFNFHTKCMYLVQHEIQIHVHTKNCKSTNLLSASQNEMSNFVVQTHLAHKQVIIKNVDLKT